MRPASIMDDSSTPGTGTSSGLSRLRRNPHPSPSWPLRPISSSWWIVVARMGSPRAERLAGPDRGLAGRGGHRDGLRPVLGDHLLEQERQRVRLAGPGPADEAPDRAPRRGPDLLGLVLATAARRPRRRW
jgi:hypothetical protein